jgi:hypothetical protein
MRLRTWLHVIRLVAGFLLTPVVLCAYLSVSMDVIQAHLGLEASDVANIFLGLSWLTCGLVAPFLFMIFFGLPYVSCMLAWKSRLTFWIVMTPTLVVAPLYSLFVYANLSSFRESHL